MKKYRVRVIYKAGFGATFDGEFLTEEEARRFLLDNVPELEKKSHLLGRGLLVG